MSHIRKSMPLISFRKGASGVGDVALAVKLNLDSKLSELEQFENWAANYQLASIKGRNEAKKQTNAINKI